MGPLGKGGCHLSLPALQLPHVDEALEGLWRLLPSECAFSSLPQLPPRLVGTASRKIYSSGAPYKVANGFNEA